MPVHISMSTTSATAGPSADRLAGRRAARRALAALLGVPASGIVLVSRRNAPPTPFVSDGCGGRHRVLAALSLAHRDGRAIASASAPSLRLGADIERVDAVHPGHARYFLSRRERGAHRAHEAPALTEHWTLKEAAWKALRCPDDTPFSALELIFDRGATLRAVAVHGDRVRARARVLRPWPGYVAAVVVVRRPA